MYDQFLLKTGRFRQYNVVLLEIRFWSSGFVATFVFVIVVAVCLESIFLRLICNVCIPVVATEVSAWLA